jgi:hypothetical protein
MGAAGSGLTKPIAEVVSAAMDGAYRTLSDKGWQGAIDTFFSQARSFDEHPLGQFVKNMIGKGVMARQQATKQLRAPTSNFKAVVKQDPNLALAHDYKTAPLGRVYASLPQGHPGKQALAPLVQNRANLGLTIDDLDHIADSKANLAGRQAAFGPSSMYLASVLHPMLTSPNPTDRTLAGQWMDIISQVFRDNKNTYDEGKVNKVSEIKTEVADLINAQRQQRQQRPITVDVSTTYQPPTGIERASNKYTMNVLAPWIAIVHTSDLLKLPAQLPAATLWKLFDTQAYAQLKGMKDRAGIFNHSLHSVYDFDFHARTGKLAQITGKPELAAMIHKMWHQPGFNNLRLFQQSVFGTAAYHSAQEWGMQAYRGEQFAADNLKDLGLDVGAIVRRGGQLTSDELEEAVFNYVNNNIFIDNPLERSKNAAKSSFFRMAYMLHGYATKEGRYVAKVLYKAAKNNQYTKLAQFLGVLGIVFPFTVAPLLKSLGVFARTADPSAAKKDIEHSYKHLTHPDGVEDFLSTYLDLVGHFSGVGVFMNVLHASLNRRFAQNVVAGAAGGALATVGEDWVRAVAKHSSPAVANAMRDSLRYSIPVLGGPLAHYMFPPKEKED